MITPRRTRLVRVPDLREFRRVISALSNNAATTAVIVPTRGAGTTLHRTLQEAAADLFAPDPLLLTRDQLYDAFHDRLETAPRRLTAFERDALAQAAATKAAREIADLPFRIRPGLVAEMLRFYDHLRRQSQQAKRFEELMTDALRENELDRGAERLLQQTRFLAGTFREYEARVRDTGACDEHGLRERLIADPSPRPIQHVIVTVPDWIADPSGLFVADFDLLSRVPGLQAIDLVSTESVLESGFHERIHSWLPGLEEVSGAAVIAPESRVRPMLVCPSATDPLHPWFVHRDREEELRAVATRVKTADLPESRLGRCAVVFKRPLPYLYIAPGTFGEAGLPYQVSDALPLAAEPIAAAVNLVLDAVETRFARDSLVALLRSPHFCFEGAGEPVTIESASAMSRALSDARYLGELTRLHALAADRRTDTASPAFEAALGAAQRLSTLLEEAPASAHVGGLLAFLEERLRPFGDDDPLAERERRGRAAVLQLLRDLASAYAAHHDPTWTIDDLSAAVRRWIGEETFAVSTGHSGVHLLDDQAARYGDFDDVTIVGLVENEWPERPRRNIFYPPALLRALNWPSEKDRRAAADARFLDLLASPSRWMTLSTFTLDDELLVARSVQLDEVPRAGLSSIPIDAVGNTDTVISDASEWALLRSDRSPATDAGFHGSIGAQAGRSWSVSALETYIACPFKFFAQHVLKLEEEPDDEEVMDPKRQGRFVHEVFETFFREWQSAGHAAITPANLSLARQLFGVVVERLVTTLPEGEAALERTRLMGSSAAAGLGEAVFRMEAERQVPVVERLLEYPFKGRFEVSTSAGAREVDVRGKADRLDLLADGTFRLIDYKLGWPPDRGRALQLPIYSICAERQLTGYRGRTWQLGEAMYLAFKGPRRVVPLFPSASARDDVLARAQQRLADTLDGIDRGEFPPAPDDVFRCETCSFAQVCRKDYVGDV